VKPISSAPSHLVEHSVTRKLILKETKNGWNIISNRKNTERIFFIFKEEEEEGSLVTFSLGRTVR
jgi:hypothetical protein